MQKGDLQTRTTFIPINKISTYCIRPQTIKFAQDLVGAENVYSALSALDYDSEVDKVVKYVFGNTLICKDINIAKKVSFFQRISKSSSLKKLSLRLHIIKIYYAVR